MERQTFGPVGRCIYCDATTYGADGKDELAEEHVIPYALRGEVVLLEASCRSCETKTNGFEQPLLKGVFLPVRLWFQMFSRKNKDPDRPVRRFSGEPGGGELPSVHISDHPVDLFFPQMFRPQILWGRELAALPKTYLWQAFLNAEGIATHGSYASYSLDLLGLYRMLAKIAHSYAVCELGIDGFVPILRDYILRGKFEGGAPWFLGGPRFHPPATDSSHEIMLISLRRIGGEVLLARIRMFAQLGAPTYYVVVGYRDSSDLAPVGRLPTKVVHQKPIEVPVSRRQ